MDGMAARGADEIVAALAGKRVEVDGPVVSGVPFLDPADMLWGDRKSGVVISSIVEGAGSKSIAGAGLNHGTLGASGFVADLVGENFGLVVCARGWKNNDGDSRKDD